MPAPASWFLGHCAVQVAPAVPAPVSLDLMALYADLQLASVILITEYCVGNTGECPADKNQLDGTVCANSTGYCYEGECPTYDEQCQFHFGSGVWDV